MSVLAISQARMGSSRLPHKVALPVGEFSLLSLHLTRLKQANSITECCVATSLAPENDEVEGICQDLNIHCFRGSEEDVLDRIYQLAATRQPDFVVRLTADCPLLDPRLLDQTVSFAREHRLDYVSSTLREAYPDGQDVEVISFASLTQCWKESKLASHREHVTPFIYLNSNLYGNALFNAATLPSDGFAAELRMTVDTAEDLNVIRELVSVCGPHASWREYAEYLLAHPELRKHNAHLNRNGWQKEIQ